MLKCLLLCLSCLLSKCLEHQGRVEWIRVWIAPKSALLHISGFESSARHCVKLTVVVVYILVRRVSGLSSHYIWTCRNMTIRCSIGLKTPKIPFIKNRVQWFLFSHHDYYMQIGIGEWGCSYQYDCQAPC